MLLSNVVQFTEGTSEPAYAVDRLGTIVAWNRAAADVFGVPPEQALSQPCYKLIRGTDEDGPVCMEDCVIRSSAARGKPARNFDIRIRTPGGMRWFNISVVSADVAAHDDPYIIHIARLVDVPKRLEMFLRDFLLDQSVTTEDGVNALVSSRRSAARDAALTSRELEILKWAAAGKTSAAIADEMCISRATVDNHLQHILKKLGVHSRLEAVLRAEHSGLL